MENRESLVLVPPIYTVSSKRLFDKCQRAWEYRYEGHLDTIARSAALQRGIEFHEEAEAVHSGTVRETWPVGYYEWADEHEDILVEDVEYPLVVPLARITDFAYNYAGSSSRGTYAGVTDIVGINHTDKKRWVLDHKSTLRFYNYPRLFASEQIGMYVISYALQRGMNMSDIAGGVISRVRITDEVAWKHFQAHITKYIKQDLGLPLGITRLRAMLPKGVDKRTKVWYNKKHANMQHATTQEEHPKHEHDSMLHAPRLMKIALRSDVLTSSSSKELVYKGVNRFDDAGRLVSSIARYGQTMVHIERKYYAFSQEELRQIARDFLKYVDQVEELKKNGVSFRRSPGLHCGWCPYRGPCEASRISPDGLGPGWKSWDEWGLAENVPANQEVLQAIAKRQRDV